jgi:5-methylcytosine-specific restriction enzyme A
MPPRPKRPCKKPGCPALVNPDEGQYCPKHLPMQQRDTRSRFDALDRRKTAETKAFYSSAQWTLTSKMHRQKEPLCRRCKKNGYVVQGELVHHNPPLEELLKTGGNPFSDDNLETLCTSCHQRELRAKYP